MCRSSSSKLHSVLLPLWVCKSRQFLLADIVKTINFSLNIWKSSGHYVYINCYNIKKYSVEITNKMQPSIRIYYSTVHLRLNMFPAAFRSSSGALTVFATSGLHTHVVTGRSQVWVGTQILLQGCILLVISTDSYYDARIHEY